MITQKHIHIPCTGLGVVIAPYNMPTVHPATISIQTKLNTFMSDKFIVPVDGVEPPFEVVFVILI